MRKRDRNLNDGDMSLILDTALREEAFLDSQPRLSVVIPAFNEETRIGSTLSDWMKFLNEHYLGNYEILVIMDGCTDQTFHVVSWLAKDSDGHIIPCFHPRRLGKGGALIEAFKESRGEVLFFTDADGSVPVSEFPRFMRSIKDDDLVLGCRYFRGSDFASDLPLGRLVFSRAFNVLLKIVFPRLRPLHDTQCGAKALHRRALDVIVEDLFITDFAFDVNLIYSALRHGLGVKEIGIKYNHFENESKVSHRLLKTGFGMFLSILRLRLYYSRFRGLIHSSQLKGIIEFLMRVV
jgi:glycosyltransferase involved in cell wall biosynthesis